MVVYPSRSGLNAWEALGNPGWGWEGLSPYIRKFQNRTAPSDANREFFKGVIYDEINNGTDGPVNVSLGDQYMPYHSAWLETFKGLGYPQVEDPINGAGIGPFVTPGSVDPVTHARSHSGVAYLGPDVQARSNLRVVTGALVQKVVLDQRSHGVVATGVQFTKDQKIFTVSAQREVVLAAGTTQTPQILELSGIGKLSVLQAHGITPIIDHAGVGENLQDHGIVPLVYEVVDGLPSGDMARDPVVAAAAMAAYQKDGSGPLGMVPFISAFMPCVDLDQPELQGILQRIEASIEDPETSITHRKQFEVLQGLIKDPEEATAQYILAPFQILPRAGDGPKSIFSLSHPGFFISMVAALSYPLSRGSVHIRSANPQDAPVIDHGMLRHPVDLALLARHSMWLEKIAEAEPMASLLKKGGERLHAAEPLTNLEKAKEICKELVLSVYHVCGTCTMMPREDGGVVDPKLKVYGTTNLRIVDASIFPLEARGNIQATVYAVAEKAADIIREDGGKASI